MLIGENMISRMSGVHWLVRIQVTEWRVLTGEYTTPYWVECVDWWGYILLSGVWWVVKIQHFTEWSVLSGEDTTSYWVECVDWWRYNILLNEVCWWYFILLNGVCYILLSGEDTTLCCVKCAKWWDICTPLMEEDIMDKQSHQSQIKIVKTHKNTKIIQRTKKMLICFDDEKENITSLKLFHFLHISSNAWSWKIQ